jgi:hypothetical protein
MTSTCAWSSAKGSGALGPCAIAGAAQISSSASHPPAPILRRGPRLFDLVIAIAGALYCSRESGLCRQCTKGQPARPFRPLRRGVVLREHGLWLLVIWRQLGAR